MNEDMPKASSKSLGVFVPSAGAALSQTGAFFAGTLIVRGHAKFDYGFSPLGKKAFLAAKGGDL
jgi:hypothetical protein